MLRYLPEIAVRNVPEPAIVAAGYGCAALLAAIGLVNLIIALHFDFVTWAWFVSVGAVGAKLVAFALQYGVSEQSYASASRRWRLDAIDQARILTDGFLGDRVASKVRSRRCCTGSPQSHLLSHGFRAVR